MRNGEGKNKSETGESTSNERKTDAAPTFQVIVLGATGGPREDSITGLLVRSTHTKWAKGSVIAVDAGAHLASIIRILEEQLPATSDTLPPKGHEITLEKGPFKDLKVPHLSAKANGLHIFRELVHSFLITHAHLDHISGLGINTPALEYGREAKAIVALPHVIEAIKTHIFNDMIWPNLSDENEGVGFVTYRRLIEGGNPRLGSGEGRGYVSVCNGLATKCWAVSHGKCKRRGSITHQHGPSMGFPNDGFSFPPRRKSRPSEESSYHAALAMQQYQMSGDDRVPKTPGTPNYGQERDPLYSSVDSSAFFLRNEEDGTEIIVFGDIEPDTVSMNPRNHLVWDDAAHKVVAGSLKAIFIECSYDDSVRDQDLYGHLCPRHLVAELRSLGQKVVALKTVELQDPPSPTFKKRKRAENPPSPGLPASTSGRRSKSRSSLKSISTGRQSRSIAPVSPSFAPEGAEESMSAPMKLPNPLAGLQVHIIHVKDTLSDGPQVGDIILKQLEEQGEMAGLGCTFNITKCGQEIWI